jgi:hypothetical protein
MNQVMISNGTVLGVAPLKTTMLYGSAALTILFTAVEPQLTAELSLLERFAFWALNIGAVMVGVVLASLILRPYLKPSLPLWAILVLTCVLGVAIATPVLVLVDWCPGDKDALDIWAEKSFLHACAAEFMEVLPLALAGWLAINLPLLFKNTHLNVEPDPNPGKDIIVDKEEEERSQQREEFLASLPEVIGRDVIAISSDLHYLNVHTGLGTAVVLGSVSRCAQFFADQGMMVHRSNWVAKQHVARVVISGSEAYCIMSNGMKVAISRSKRKEVKNTFGGASLYSIEKNREQIG